jgi:hypothetical protein
VRGEELGFGGFPGGGQSPIHSAASLGGILLAVRMLRLKMVILKLLSTNYTEWNSNADSRAASSES